MRRASSALMIACLLGSNAQADSCNRPLYLTFDVGNMRHAEHIAAVQWARLLQPELGTYVEGIGVLGAPADLSGSYFGAGLSWQAHEHLALEAGLLFGLGGDAEDFRLLLGATTTLAQLGKIGLGSF